MSGGTKRSSSSKKSCGGQSYKYYNMGSSGFVLNSTANIKALRGSLGALSVNKLSHIPKLQPISVVYENQ